MNQRLLEISKRKQEIRELLEDESKEVNVEELKTEVETLEAEETTINETIQEEVKAEEEKQEEKRALAEKLDKGNATGHEIDKSKKEEKSMKKDIKSILKSEEYRSAWAKKLMNRPEADFTEEEKRALGDAVTTTATTFVEATAEANGINNGGLLIPTSVRTEILAVIEQTSPFYRDVRKLAVAGNIELPYLDESDDANWVTENTDTVNEGAEFKKVSLAGHELAKNIVVTWKLEKMAVDSFITFITQELAQKIGKALVSALFYGNGSGKATGAIYGLSATTGADPIETIVNTYKTLSQEFRIGAKAYISTDVNIDIVGYKDEMGTYPYINGVSATKLVNIEVDPFLVDGDICVGNPLNYILNVQEELTIARETKAVGRKTIYAGYQIADGKPRPGAFKKGSYVTTSA